MVIKSLLEKGRAARLLFLKSLHFSLLASARIARAYLGM